MLPKQTWLKETSRAPGQRPQNKPNNEEIRKDQKKKTTCLLEVPFGIGPLGCLEPEVNISGSAACHLLLAFLME